MESIVLEDKRLCACGCGKTLIKTQKRYYDARYAWGHNIKRGLLHPAWRGGRVVVKRGYIMIAKQFSHPRNKKGYVFEHILVYEAHYNCCVLPWAAVHHKDGNKANNVWYNLQAMTRNQHGRLHPRPKR